MAEQPLRLGFGSCNNQHKTTPIFESIAASELAAFMFLGDSVYQDVEDCASFNREVCGEERHAAARARLEARRRRRDDVGAAAEALEHLARSYEGFDAQLNASAFFERVPQVLATWDDHDYGENDAGGDLPWKAGSLAAFQTMWRRSPAMEFRDDGVYGAYDVGEAVRLIVLDTRYERSPISMAPDEAPREDMMGGQYVPNATGRVLGDAQWAWLEAELAKPPKALTVVATSTQFLVEFNGCETWGNFPTDRDRLVGLLPDSPTLILSGDPHYTQVSARWNLFEVTASGLTETWPEPHPNRFRVDPSSVVRDPNFGVLSVDVDARTVDVVFHDERGSERYRKVLTFDQLSRHPAGRAALAGDSAGAPEGDYVIVN